MISLLENSEKTELLNFSDPFKSDKISMIAIHIFKSSYDGSLSISGKVKFENGKTKGEQEFESADFNSLVKQIDDFIKAL